MASIRAELDGAESKRDEYYTTFEETISNAQQRNDRKNAMLLMQVRSAAASTGGWDLFECGRTGAGREGGEVREGGAHIGDRIRMGGWGGGRAR